MGKKKQETTNTYTQITPQNTPDTQAWRDWKPQSDPSIPYRFGRARQDLRDSFRSPYGQYSTPAIRDATLRTGEQELLQQEGQAMREGQYDVNNQNSAKLSGLAGLTAPHIVGSGSTTTQSGGFLGDLLLSMAGGGSQGAGAGAATALM